MKPTTHKDKILNFDFHFAICLLAIDELNDALCSLHTAIWLLTNGDDNEAAKFYRKTYRGLLKRIADEAYPLTVTDEFRKQYEAQANARD